MTQTRNISNDLVRSEKECVLAGVCGGIGQKIGLESWILRVLFLVAFPLFFLGPILYLILVFTLPQDKFVQEAYQAKFLGVCYRLSVKYNWEVGIVRFIFVSCLLLSIVPSFGVTILIYLVLHFVLPDLESPSNPKQDYNVVDVEARDINR